MTLFSLNRVKKNIKSTYPHLKHYSKRKKNEHKRITLSFSNVKKRRKDTRPKDKNYLKSLYDL